MNKLNKAIFYSFALLAILITAPTETKAASGSNVYFSGNSDYNSGGYYYPPTYYQEPAPIYYVQQPTVIPAPAPTPTLYSSTVNPNATPAPKAAAKAETPATPKADEPASTLAANAIFGENGFLPTGLIQWAFLAILVLGGTILVRTIYGANANYNATPMKHD